MQNLNETIKLFPSINLSLDIIANDLLATREDKDRLIVAEYKDKVLEFIKIRKTLQLTDIMDEFGLTIFEVKMIINTLEQEKKIIING